MYFRRVNAGNIRRSVLQDVISSSSPVLLQIDGRRVGVSGVGGLLS